MKKFTLALTGLVAVSAASAQSSVTLFGVVDMAVSGYKSQSQTPNGTTVSESKTALSTGGYNTSRIGFRGSEDLGGGLAASFWLEAGITPDTGNGSATGGGLNFNRRSTVSLSGNFGELRLGRDYTPNYWNDNVFDPFTVLGVGANLIFVASNGANFGIPNSSFQTNANYARASNSVGYFLPPNLGGFYGQLMYAFNEQTSYDPGGLTPPGAVAVAAKPALATADNARAGRYVGGRVGYTQGALNIAAAYAQSVTASNFYAGSTTAVDIFNLGATYDFGVLKLFGEYSNNKQKTDLAASLFNPLGATDPGFDGALVGVTVPIGAGLIRAAYSEVKYSNVHVSGFTSEPRAHELALGYVYNLSKRTALYASTSYIKNEDGAALAFSSAGAPTYYTGPVPGAGTAVPNKSVGYDLGIRHSF